MNGNSLSSPFPVQEFLIGKLFSSVTENIAYNRRGDLMFLANLQKLQSYKDWQQEGINLLFLMFCFNVRFL